MIIQESFSASWAAPIILPIPSNRLQIFFSPRAIPDQRRGPRAVGRFTAVQQRERAVQGTSGHCVLTAHQERGWRCEEGRRSFNQTPVELAAGRPSTDQVGARCWGWGRSDSRSNLAPDRSLSCWAPHSRARQAPTRVAPRKSPAPDGKAPVGGSLASHRFLRSLPAAAGRPAHFFGYVFSNLFRVLLSVKVPSRSTTILIHLPSQSASTLAMNVSGALCALSAPIA